MRRNGHRKHLVCKNCGTRFAGRYCPYCGAEHGRLRALRSGGFAIGLLRFLLLLIALVLFLFLLFVVLDFFASAEGGAHATAQAVFSSIENAIPESLTSAYADFRELCLAPAFAFLAGLLR